MNMRELAVRVRNVAAERVWYAVSLAMTVGIVGAITISLLSGAIAADQQRADVYVAPVLTKRIRQWDSFNGRISAIESVEVRPRVSGYIDSISYREGDEIR